MKPFQSASVVFGVEGGRGGRVTAMAAYKVKLITLEEEQEFECPYDEYILDVVEGLGLDLPYSCRVGSFSFVLAKLSPAKSTSQTITTLMTTKLVKAGFLAALLTQPLILLSRPTRRKTSLLKHYHHRFYFIKFSVKHSLLPSCVLDAAPCSAERWFSHKPLRVFSTKHNISQFPFEEGTKKTSSCIFIQLAVGLFGRGWISIYSLLG